MARRPRARPYWPPASSAAWLIGSRRRGRDGLGATEVHRRSGGGHRGVAPVQADGTDNAPTDVAWPMPAERDEDCLAPRPLLKPSAPGLDMSPTDWGGAQLVGGRRRGFGCGRQAARREQLGQHAHRH